jgi:hypothetical protein
MLSRRPSLDEMHLSAGAQRVLTTPNAGGSSIASEALSCEVLCRVMGAQLLETEMGVVYKGRCSMTDFVIAVGGEIIGVSVTRAFNGHPANRVFTR